MGSVLLSTPIIAPTNLDRHQILRNFCHESVRKGLKDWRRERRGRAVNTATRLETMTSSVAGPLGIRKPVVCQPTR